MDLPLITVPLAPPSLAMPATGEGFAALLAGLVGADVQPAQEAAMPTDLPPAMPVLPETVVPTLPLPLEADTTAAAAKPEAAALDLPAAATPPDAAIVAASAEAAVPTPDLQGVGPLVQPAVPPVAQPLPAPAMIATAGGEATTPAAAKTAAAMQHSLDAPAREEPSPAVEGTPPEAVPHPTMQGGAPPPSPVIATTPMQAATTEAVTARAGGPRPASASPPSPQPAAAPSQDAAPAQDLVTASLVAPAIARSVASAATTGAKTGAKAGGVQPGTAPEPTPVDTAKAAPDTAKDGPATTAPRLEAPPPTGAGPVPAPEAGPIGASRDVQAASLTPRIPPELVPPTPPMEGAAPPAVSAPTQPESTPPPRPAPVAAPARQVAPFAVALSLGPDARLDLTLDPVELGRVEVAIERQGNEAVVSLRAERPETLALLQRDRAELERALSDAGLRNSEGGGPSLSFGLGGETGARQERRQPNPRHAPPPQRPDATPQALAPRGLIDLAL